MESEFLPFAHWEGFYVIVGTSAAALTGLQFVVITLVAEFRPQRSQGDIDTFATPTIVHFAAVLFISAVLGAPWHHYGGAAFVLGLSGLIGIVYAALVIRRATKITSYKPVLEDWVWHAVLPLVAYSTLFVASLFVAYGSTPALFAVGATALLLMFIGIHNAWDTVTYVTLEGKKGPDAADRAGP